MADPIITGAPASTNEQAEPRTLAPSEYLEWMLSLERAGNLPKGVRAYLVTLGPNDSRQLRAVGMNDSVVNVRTGLARHLADTPMTSEALSELRDFCNQRLKDQGEAGLVEVDPELVRIGHAATHEIQTLAALLRREVEERDATGEVSAVARGMLLRIELLSDIAFDAITDARSDAADVEDLSRKLGE